MSKTKREGAEKKANRKKLSANKQKSTMLARKREARRNVKKITFGVTDALTNVALYFLYVSANMIAEGGKGPITVDRAFNKADSWITEFDGKKLRKAFYNLSQRGLISSIKEASTLPRITKVGLKRLESVFPFYDAVRAWDEKLYVVIYDIPLGADRQRNILRDNLLTIKAAQLQKSAYLTPYNPREIILAIKEKHNIPGQILITTLDPKNAFGGTSNIKELLWEIYELEDVNQDYKGFINKYKLLNPKAVKEKNLQIKVAFAYLSILQDDPQLPFQLLPNSYLGDEAYLLFHKLTGIK